MRLPKGKPMPSAVCRFQTQYLRNWTSWRVAEVLKDEFAYNQSQRRSIPLLSYKTKAGANYRAFWQDSLPMSPWVLQRTGLTHARTALTSKRFQNILCQLILRTKDIHSLTSALDTDTRKTILPCCHCPKSNASVPKQESAHLAAVFCSKKGFHFCSPCSVVREAKEVYFDKLQNLYMTFTNISWPPFVQTLAKDILAHLVAEAQSKSGRGWRGSLHSFISLAFT